MAAGIPNKAAANEVGRAVTLRDSEAGAGRTEKLGYPMGGAGRTEKLDHFGESTGEAIQPLSELTEGIPIDKRSDIYSLGETLYHIQRTDFKPGC